MRVDVSLLLAESANQLEDVIQLVFSFATGVLSPFAEMWSLLDKPELAIGFLIVLLICEPAAAAQGFIDRTVT